MPGFFEMVYLILGFDQRGRCCKKQVHQVDEDEDYDVIGEHEKAMLFQGHWTTLSMIPKYTRDARGIAVEGVRDMIRDLGGDLPPPGHPVPLRAPAQSSSLRVAAPPSVPLVASPSPRLSHEQAEFKKAAVTSFAARRRAGARAAAIEAARG